MERIIDTDALRLMTVDECAGHTLDYAKGWKACIDWIKTLPTIEAEPARRWISVEDRLPEKSGDVLVCSRGYCLPVPYSQRWKAFNASDYDDGTKHALNSVTHWMPLPEMPEEEDA